MVTYQWFTPTKCRARTRSSARSSAASATSRCAAGSSSTSRRTTTTGSRRQPTFAQTQALPGRQRDAPAPASYAPASACHGPRGEGNPQLNAPKLAGPDDWYLAPAAASTSSTASAAREGDTFGAQMAPMSQLVRGPGHARERARATSRRCRTTPRRRRSTGDVERGRRLFETCAACHGDNGEGHLGAQRAAARGHERLVPRAAARELQGTASAAATARTIYGEQMDMMANSLVGPNARQRRGGLHQYAPLT